MIGCLRYKTSFEDREIQYSTHRSIQSEQLRKTEQGVDFTIGGLRRPVRSLAALPQVKQIGLQVRKVIMDIISQDPKITKSCVQAIGLDDPKAGPSQEVLVKVRLAIKHGRVCAVARDAGGH